MEAYRHWEDGKQWIRIISKIDVWDEPIHGWSEIWNLTSGEMTYRHLDGREIKSKPQ